MNMPTLIIYDDSGGRFGPITSLRAIFQARTGAVTTRERVERILGNRAYGLWAPKRLCGVLNNAFPDRVVNPQDIPGESILLVNGRWLGLRFAEQVRGLAKNQAVVQSDGQVVAVYLDAQLAGRFLKSGCRLLPDHITTLRLRERVLIDRPWHILDELPLSLAADLEADPTSLIDASKYAATTVIGQHTIKVNQHARLMPYVVLDAEQGPIVIDAHTEVRSFTVLQGPCYIGPDTIVMPHTWIRPNTVIGPTCRIGGEVSSSIFHGYSNKAHIGFVGDSLIGEWVNLGSGTTTSNLKNTYGSVRLCIDDDAGDEDSGRTFLGAMIGDYVRTAVGTHLPTGAVIHPACMLAVSGWAPKLAKAKGFYTDNGYSPADPEKLTQVMQRLVERRGATLSYEVVSLILSLS